MKILSKSPQDSYYEKHFAFSSDEALRDSYVNFFGDLRFGKLLEELDWTAGAIAYQHADGFDKQLVIVTAACDRIDLLGPLRSDCDLKLSGHVGWVGNSSMEVELLVESKIGDDYELVIRAYFIMVARKDGLPAKVNRLTLKTEAEKAFFAEGEQRQAQRKMLSQTSAFKRPPTAEESAMLHELYWQQKLKTLEGRRMQDTFRQATIIMHPQDRNIFHKIFGGYLMRQSFELGWNIAYLYSGRRPLVVCIDHMYFYQPVEIGSIVSFDGQVIYTGKTSFLIQVTTEVIDPKTQSVNMTNECYLTFVSVDEEAKPLEIPAILPHSYEENLKYLDGAKRYRYSKELREE